MFNITILMGRLVVDSEPRYTTSDTAITGFTIVADRSYAKSSAERQTDLIDTAAWRSATEFVCKCFHKGQLIVVQDSVQTRNYQDKDGNKRRVFEVVADSVHFAELKREGGTPSPGYGSYSHSDALVPSAPVYTSGNAGDFEEIPADDSPPF